MWQPIETAPMDGTPILLTNGLLFGGGRRMRIYDGEPFWYVNGCSAFDPEEGTSDYDGPLQFSPTHWMPLPKPPGQLECCDGGPQWGHALSCPAVPD